MLFGRRGRRIAAVLVCAATPLGCTATGSAGTRDGGAVDEPDAHTTIQVTMNANDPSGSGDNTEETYLNVNTVAAATFGKLFSLPVDGDQYAQPLYAGGLTFKDGTTRNVVFAATSNDSVYAFDADKAGAPIWKVNVGTPSPMPNDYVGNTTTSVTGCKTMNRFINELGVSAGPVLDPATGTLYVLAVDVDSSTTIPNWSCVHTDATKANYCQPYTCTAPTFRYRLHALDLLTGADKVDPVTVQGSVAGSGGGTDGQGQIAFNSMTQFARVGLLLSNGNVYFAFASYSDLDVYHGWIFAYDAATLKQVGQFCDTSDGTLGGIWQSGRSLLSDGTYIYAVTGNGTFDANVTGGHDYGDSVIKLKPDLTEVVDYFSPYLTDYQSYDFLTAWDDDLGSAGATMIPGTTLLLATGKLGNGYLLDRSNLGQWNSGSDKVVQKIRLTWKTTKTSCTDGVSESIVNSTPVVWAGPDATRLYVWGSLDDLRAYVLDKNGQFSSQGVCFCSTEWQVAGPNDTIANLPADPPCGVTDSKSSSPATLGGGALSISSNGKERGTGVLWATHALSGNTYGMSSPGVIEAYDATDVSTPIWSSATKASDGFGNWAKFTPPTIANGKVYVPTFSKQLFVYGLLAKP